MLHSSGGSLQRLHLNCLQAGARACQINKPGSAQVARLEGFAAARLEDVCLVLGWLAAALATQLPAGRRPRLPN